MAITWLESDVVWGSSPKFQRSVGYEETGRTASNVTYKIYLKLKVKGSSSSFYGYSINWKVDGGSTMKIKDASPRWYGNEGYREFTTTITKSASSGGGTTSFSVQVIGGHSSSGSPNFNSTYNAKISTWNTAPTWSSTAKLTARANNSSGAVITSERDGTENSIKIAENVSAIYLSWDSASDNEGNVSKYELYNQVSESAWSLIYSGSARNYTHNIGGGASTQGKSYDYYVVAVDSYGGKSDSLDLRQFQKNQLTGANLSVNSGIAYSTSEITLTWSGASNTNGNTSFTYSIGSSGVTVYNKEKLTASGGKITILKSGTSTNPYILFDDLKTLVNGSSSKTGSFTLSLTTKNAYGSTVTKNATVKVDLRTNPKAPTTITVGGKVSTSLGNYLIPSRSNAVISWSGASDYLGGALSYDVYYKVGSGSEVLVNAGTSTSANIKLPTPSSATTVAFRVVAKTTYGNSASSSTVSDTIHYYNPPTVSIGDYNRTNSNVSLTITNAVNSSIPNIAFAKQSYTGNGTTANYTGAKYTATISGLNESSAFTFTATVNDNTGLSSDVSASFKVTPATPKLSVRENGVGVNCVNNTSQALAVEGGANIKGGLIVDGKDLLKELTKSLYPVGSIYMSTTSTNPSTYFGGTWVAWGGGRVPVGINTGDTDFDTVEKTGGSKSYSASHTHTTAGVSLTVEQLPAHNHSASSDSAGGHTHKLKTQKTKWGASGSNNVMIDATSDYTALSNPTTTSSGSHSHTITVNNTGSGKAHSHGNTGSSSVSLSSVQPYITCYMWKRTA